MNKWINMYDKLGEISFRDLLGYSIKGEEMAHEAYKELSKKLRGLAAERFKTLAQDEWMHRKVLLKLHEKEFGDRDFNVPDEEGLPPHEGSFIDIKKDDVNSLIEAINKAMEAEDNAYRVYKHLAETEEEHEQLFKYIAAMEKGHYASLKEERDMYKGVTGEKKDTGLLMGELKLGKYDSV